MTRKQWIGVLLAAVLVVGGFVWAFRPRPVPVEVAPVRLGLFQQNVEEDGKTRVRERYVVSSPIAGRLARIHLKPGDVVKAGMAVALLAPAAPGMIDARAARELTERVGAAQAALDQARANVARNDAAQVQAKADLARQTKLVSEGFVAASAVEQAQLAMQVQTRSLEAARFGQEGARHDLAQARAALMRVQDGAKVLRPAATWAIESPVAGRVLRVLQESEITVGVGTPLLEIADPHDLEVVVDVLSSDGARIAPGARVSFEIGRGVDLDGRVRRVEPAAFTKISALGVEEQRVNVIIDITSPQERWRALGDQFRVDARIIVFERAGAVIVPVAALFRASEDWAVFVAAGGTAERRIVKVGARTPIEAWIEEGLAPGERVIVYPSERVEPGVRVAVVRGG